MLEKLKKFAIEQVLWAEKNLSGKTGAEKKAVVVKKIDDLIVLPSYMEWADDLIISWLVDKVCEKLNAMTEHNFKGLELDSRQEQELAGEIEIKERGE